MSDDLTPHRPHVSGWQVCLTCHDIHMAVLPLVMGKPVLSECPKCGAMACIPLPEVKP